MQPIMKGPHSILIPHQSSQEKKSAKRQRRRINFSFWQISEWVFLFFGSFLIVSGILLVWLGFNANPRLFDYTAEAARWGWEAMAAGTTILFLAWIIGKKNAKRAFKKR